MCVCVFIRVCAKDAAQRVHNVRSNDSACWYTCVCSHVAAVLHEIFMSACLTLYLPAFHVASEFLYRVFPACFFLKIPSFFNTAGSCERLAAIPVDSKKKKILMFDFLMQTGSHQCVFVLHLCFYSSRLDTSSLFVLCLSSSSWETGCVKRC